MKLLTITLIAFFSITSGFSQAFVKNYNPDPQIHITGSQGDNLTLNPVTPTARNYNIVMWVIDEDSGVKNILGITKKWYETNVVFVPGDPHRIAPVDRSSWIGRIEQGRTYPSAPQYLEYFYMIIWEDMNGDLHVFDPSIKVNQ